VSAWEIIVIVVGFAAALLVVAFILWALVSISRDRELDPASRTVWLALVLLLPVAGAFAWVFLSSRGIRTLRSIHLRF